MLVLSLHIQVYLHYSIPRYRCALCRRWHEILSMIVVSNINDFLLDLAFKLLLGLVFLCLFETYAWILLVALQVLVLRDFKVRYGTSTSGLELSGYNFQHLSLSLSLKCPSSRSSTCSSRSSSSGAYMLGSCLLLFGF
jgi:hypothetical protein